MCLRQPLSVCVCVRVCTRDVKSRTRQKKIKWRTFGGKSFLLDLIWRCGVFFFIFFTKCGAARSQRRSYVVLGVASMSIAVRFVSAKSFVFNQSKLTGVRNRTQTTRNSTNFASIFVLLTNRMEWGKYWNGKKNAIIRYPISWNTNQKAIICFDFPNCWFCLCKNRPGVHRVLSSPYLPSGARCSQPMRLICGRALLSMADITNPFYWLPHGEKIIYRKYIYIAAFAMIGILRSISSHSNCLLGWSWVRNKYKSKQITWSADLADWAQIWMRPLKFIWQR